MNWYLGVGWVACGFLHYGFFVAYFQRTYPTIAEKDWFTDRVISGIAAILGPITLVATLALGFYKKGWML